MRSPRRSGKVSAIDPLAAFLNVPYDERFRDLYLSYIAAISAKGLTPRATLEIPGGVRRLDRTLELVSTCRYSFHDLSRVEIDKTRPVAPRFNMPFELGLTVAWERMHPRDGYFWFVLEAKERRVLKSLSDLAGTDVYIHAGTVTGIFRQIGNALVRTGSQRSIRDMTFVYRRLRALVPALIKQTGAKTVFEAALFKELVVSAAALSKIRETSSA